MTIPANQATDLVSIEKRRAMALDQARMLLPKIRERATATDADRCVPEATIEALFEADLFSLMTPRTFGGRELGIETLVRVTTEIAGACGSTGWVYGVLAGHSWLLNLFPIKAQQEVFANPQDLTATVFWTSDVIADYFFLIPLLGLVAWAPATAGVVMDIIGTSF